MATLVAVLLLSACSEFHWVRTQAEMDLVRTPQIVPPLPTIVPEVVPPTETVTAEPTATPTIEVVLPTVTPTPEVVAEFPTPAVTEAVTPWPFPTAGYHSCFDYDWGFARLWLCLRQGIPE